MAPARRMTRSNREVYPIMFLPICQILTFSSKLAENQGKKFNYKGYEWDHCSLLRDTEWLISSKRTALSCSSSLVRIEHEVITFCLLIRSPFKLFFIFSSVSKLFFNSLQLLSKTLQLLLSLLMLLLILTLSVLRLFRFILSSLQSCRASVMPSFNLSDLILRSFMALLDFSMSLLAFFEFISARLLSFFSLTISSLRKAIFYSRCFLYKMSSVLIWLCLFLHQNS